MPAVIRMPILPVVLLAVVTVCGGCGEDVKRGTRIQLGFALDFDRSIREGRFPVDADREQAFDATMRVVAERLDRSGIDVRVRDFGHEGFEIAVPLDQRPFLESIVRLVSAVGELAFRIEVLPVARYPRWNKERMPPRLEQESTYPWRGTAEEFAAFKDQEVRRFRDARDKGTVYTPSDPRYFVVPRFGAEAGDERDFALLEEPLDPRDRFDGTILAHPRSGRQPTTGRPVVLYDVKAENQDAFERWTGANVGLPMAIVLDGVCRTAPIVNSALRDSVQITLGTGSASDLEKQAEELTAVLQTGSLPVRLRLVSEYDPERHREDR